MSEVFTRVDIAFYPEHLNNWLRFGEPDEQQDLDRRRSLALFKPGCVFGYVRWRANEYGTQDWRFTIVKTAAPSLLLSRIDGVHPGGEVLLLVTGNTKVKRALLQIDALEAAGFEPSEVSPAYYRHIHNRIAAGRPVRDYSEAQHQAHLTAQGVSP
ncbi:MAG: DUF2840 domain-containing protein [Gammaproteobacteria bacterium]